MLHRQAPTGQGSMAAFNWAMAISIPMKAVTTAVSLVASRVVMIMTWGIGSFGASVDYDFADLDISGSSDSIEEIFRAKLRGGYKVGRGLIYATAGYANADSDNSGNDDGYFFGGGYDYLVTDRFSVGTEILYHDFNNFDSSDTDVEITTLQVRGTFRF